MIKVRNNSTDQIILLMPTSTLYLRPEWERHCSEQKARQLPQGSLVEGIANAAGVDGAHSIIRAILIITLDSTCKVMLW